MAATLVFPAARSLFLSTDLMLRYGQFSCAVSLKTYDRCDETQREEQETCVEASQDRRVESQDGTDV